VKIQVIWHKVLLTLYILRNPLSSLLDHVELTVTWVHGFGIRGFGIRGFSPKAGGPVRGSLSMGFSPYPVFALNGENRGPRP
jgi:hypothetical protein